MIEITLKLHPDDSEMVELRGTTNSGKPILWGVVHVDMLHDPHEDIVKRLKSGEHCDDLLKRLKAGDHCDIELNIL